MRKRYQHLHRTSLISSEEVSKKPKTKRRRSKTKIFLLTVFIVLLGVIGYLAISSIGAANNILASNITVASLIRQSSLKQTDGITNVLLLGRDQAANLTDSIEIVRIRHSDKKVAMISIPRDLQVKIYHDGVGKVNAVFSQGYNQENDKDQRVTAGADLASKTISDIAGIPIHYYVVADFSGLKDMVDALGGVTIDVQKGFYDPEYPNDYFTKDGTYVKTDGYSPFSVEAGVQTMDGTTALKYARSRHGSNGEGSDFARAARQQQVILAIKSKALSAGVLANPAKISNFLGALGNHVKTSMTASEFKDVIDLASGIDKTNTISKVISNDSNEGLLVSTDVGGYYLIPKAGSGNFTQVQNFIKNIFSDENAIPVQVEVYNGTKTIGLAGTLGETLQKDGYNVTKIDNSETLYDKTTIVDGTSSSAVYKQIKKIVGTAERETSSDKSKIQIYIGSDYGK